LFRLKLNTLPSVTLQLTALPRAVALASRLRLVLLKLTLPPFRPVQVTAVMDWPPTLLLRARVVIAVADKAWASPTTGVPAVMILRACDTQPLLPLKV